MNQRYMNCVDCGLEKSTERQKCTPRCRSCGMKAAHKRPGVKERYSAASKEAQNRPDVKEKKSASAKIVHNKPDVKEKKSAVIKAALSHPKMREKISVAVNQALSRPEVAAKRWAIANRPDVRIRNSLAQGGDGDLKRIDRRRKRTAEYNSSIERAWSQSVKFRDGHTCQHCGATKWLHAHHVKPRAMFPELALELDNGLTLCKDCHVKEHRRLRGQSR